MPVLRISFGLWNGQKNLESFFDIKPHYFFGHPTQSYSRHHGFSICTITFEGRVQRLCFPVFVDAASPADWCRRSQCHIISSKTHVQRIFWRRCLVNGWGHGMVSVHTGRIVFFQSFAPIIETDFNFIQLVLHFCSIGIPRGWRGRSPCPLAKRKD